MKIKKELSLTLPLLITLRSPMPSISSCGHSSNDIAQFVGMQAPWKSRIIFINLFNLLILTIKLRILSLRKYL